MEIENSLANLVFNRILAGNEENIEALQLALCEGNWKAWVSPEKLKHRARSDHLTRLVALLELKVGLNVQFGGGNALQRAVAETGIKFVVALLTPNADINWPPSGESPGTAAKSKRKLI
jgi:hypothetical protein